MSMRAGIAIAVLLTLSPLASASDDWGKEKDQLTASCSNLFGDIRQIGSCGQFLFSSGMPLRLTIPQSIVPGGGVALGATYIHKLDITNWTDSTFTLQGGSSLRSFWFGDAVLTLDHKKFIHPLEPGDRFQIKVYSHARGLPQMPFYGIGPNTSRDSIVNFSEQDISAGASVLNPINSWLDIGGGVEYLKPQIGGVNGASIRSIDQYYSEATAPGLTHQPGFVHYQVSAQPKYSWRRTSFNSEVSFHQYQDAGRGGYSFHKFRTDFLQKIYPETQTEPTAGGAAKRKQPRYDSVLYIGGRFSAASPSAGNVIPFYLQETLGGSDINNIATLRGFQDYRFRGPDLFSLQVQYERRLLPAPPRGSPRASTLRSIAGALGILAFYDAGEVAASASNLNFSDVRQSFGFGLTFWSGEKVWFRAYIGLGSGEGSHTFVGITNPGAQNVHL